MLSQFASYLWNWLSGLWNSFAGWLGGVIQSAVDAVGGFFTWLANTIGGFFQNLLTGIGQILQDVFSPIYSVLNALFYFVQQLLTVLYLLFQLIVSIVHLLLSFGEGLIQTFLGLTYDGSSPVLPGDVQDPFTHMQFVLGLFQLDNLAYVLHFAIWFATALAVVRMIGNFGQGGASD